MDALGDQHKDYMNEIKLFLAVAHGYAAGVCNIYVFDLSFRKALSLWNMFVSSRYAKGDKAQMQRDVAEPAIEKYYTILEKQAKVKLSKKLRCNYRTNGLI